MIEVNDAVNKVVNAYFENPNKTLKEIFQEYTENFSEEETKAFYEKLKVIVS